MLTQNKVFSFKASLTFLQSTTYTAPLIHFLKIEEPDPFANFDEEEDKLEENEVVQEKFTTQVLCFLLELPLKISYCLGLFMCAHATCI